MKKLFWSKFFFTIWKFAILSIYHVSVDIRGIPVNNTPLSKNTPPKCPKYFLRGVFLSNILGTKGGPFAKSGRRPEILGILDPKQSRKRCFRRVKTYSDMHKTKNFRLRRAKWHQTNQNLSILRPARRRRKNFRCVFRVFQLNSRILTKIVLKNTPPLNVPKSEKSQLWNVTYEISETRFDDEKFCKF